MNSSSVHISITKAYGSDEPLGVSLSQKFGEDLKGVVHFRLHPNLIGMKRHCGQRKLMNGCRLLQKDLVAGLAQLQSLEGEGVLLSAWKIRRDLFISNS